MPRLIAILADGLEPTVVDAMLARGALPALGALRNGAASFGVAHRGLLEPALAGDLFATGLPPERSARHDPLQFDPATYGLRRLAPAPLPVAARLQSRALVLDLPWFDLEGAPTVRGVSGWGLRAGNRPRCARPAALLDELEREAGAYPAGEWLDPFAWPTEAARARAGTTLASAVDARTKALRWLLQRLPEWQIALIGVPETRAAAEADGPQREDPRSPDGASEPGGAMAAVCSALDRMVGTLLAEHPDAQWLLCSMHGMGADRGDVASLALLPELLYRDAFGRPLLQPLPGGERPDAPDDPGSASGWEAQVLALLPGNERKLWRTTLAARAPAWMQPLARRLAGDGDADPGLLGCPALAYRPWWPEMRAFALPSLDDARIRLNLVGRERDGKVLPQQYAQAQRDLERLLRDCRDPRDGTPAVASVTAARIADPCALGPTEADLVVRWQRPLLALGHPRLGRIGPLPRRRRGGPSDAPGLLWIRAPGVAAGPRGQAQAIDVVPTMLALLGETGAARLPGRSLA